MGLLKSFLSFTFLISVTFLLSLSIDDPELGLQTKLFSLTMKHLIVPYMASLDFEDPFYDIPHPDGYWMSVDTRSAFVDGYRTWDSSVMSEDGVFEIPFRVFEPENRVGRLPVVIWAHGGGFVLGRFNDGSSNNDCAWFVKEANVICISIEYRLAPRYAWTKGKEDGYSVMKYVMKEGNGLDDIIDREQIYFAGESAGATIAMTSAMFMNDKDHALPIAGLVLIYPVFTHGHNDEANKYILTDKMFKLFTDAMEVNPTVDEYIDTISESNPYNFTGFPKTILISAEYDRILPSSIKLESLLAHHNVQVERHHYIDVHGFYSFNFSPNSAPAKQKVLEFLKQN